MITLTQHGLAVLIQADTFAQREQAHAILGERVFPRSWLSTSLAVTETSIDECFAILTDMNRPDRFLYNQVVIERLIRYERTW